MFFKALLISIFSDACKIQSLIPALAAVMFQKVMIVIPLIGLFLSRDLIVNFMKGFSPKYGKALIFLVAWMVLSLPFSVYPGESFRFLTEHLWKILLSFCLIVAYGNSRESLDKMIWAFLVAVGVLGVFAFLYSGIGRFSVIAEYDPNENALLFVLAVPFVFWKMMTSKGFRKLMMACLFCLVVIGIVQTKSRGGFLGLVAVAAVSLYQYRHIGKISIVKIALVALFLYGIMYFAGGEAYKTRITTMFDTQEYNYTADSGRLTIWKQGLSLMLHNPILGVGPDAFTAALGMTFRWDEGQWQAAHNSFIQVGAELGFPGLIAYCFIIISTMRKLLKIISGQSGQDAANKKANFTLITAYSLLGSWVGFIVSGSLLSVAYGNLVFFLLGTSWAFINVASSPLQSTAHDTAVPDTQTVTENLQPAGLTAGKRRKYDRNRYLPF